MSERKIPAKDFLHLIQCKLCNGVLVNSTTIIECLHTFCKSCLVKHLQKADSCPMCGNVVHQSEALRYQYISHDRTFQDVVDALLPEIKKNELERERQFYLEHPELPNPRMGENGAAFFPAVSGSQPAVLPVRKITASDCHRNDVQISVQLECKSSALKPLKRRYLLCSIFTEIHHLKKFLAAQLFNNTSRWQELDIMCNDVSMLGRNHTLQYIKLVFWNFRELPLVLTYRRRSEAV
ncbi:polycomb group RING finger protein 3-like [Paramacrobiotus metropolitanus]|uniref:polycomb group RING finger protein 3-like n=1 Tax=Paramacrobiotus metropolitanus TaxID=2943436 RepID=UPI002445B17E|nr:polycomb group RING finger protein 3-like [Paramacrobiotus metropolitanus]XP_055335486.1 polycomb group RING finger protein 3-like [Paramacrobiotus metropolitanus]